METFGQNYIDIEENEDIYTIPEEAGWGFIPLPEEKGLKGMGDRYIRERKRTR